MSERFKYAKNGICRVENFPEHLAAGTFPRIGLGRSCGMNWYSELRTNDDDDIIYPVIWCDNDDSEVEHRVRIYYNLLNNSVKQTKSYEITHRTVLPFDEVSKGCYIPFLEIFDLKNGWLDIDGALSFEYGIQVEAIYENSIWRFNFKDRLFNGGAEMIEFKKAVLRCLGCYYLHAQLLTHHSQMYADLISHMTEKSRFILSENLNSFLDFEDALQVLHGVRLQLKHDRLLSLLSIAGWHKMRNVVYYCDVLLTQRGRRSRYKNDEKKWISLANKYNLRHWMAELLKPMKSVKDCVDEENIENMSNESMKMFVAKFLYEKF